MNHEMKLRQKYFDKIKTGEKIFEIRLFDEKRKLISLHDQIIFRNENNLNEVINTEVLSLQIFESFEDMAKTLGSKKSVLVILK